MHHMLPASKGFVPNFLTSFYLCVDQAIVVALQQENYKQTDGSELFKQLKIIKECKNHNSFNFPSDKHDKMVETINVHTAGFQMSL